ISPSTWRNGTSLAAGATLDACRGHHGLPRLGARRPPSQTGGNERAVARDGRHPEFRPVQPRPPDLCRIEARRYREIVRAKVRRHIIRPHGEEALVSAVSNHEMCSTSFETRANAPPSSD